MLTASCASTNNSSLIGANAPANTLNRLADVSAGESLELEGTTWVVERTYVAASGRVCKRLRDGNEEIRVGCQNQTKGWYLRKPLIQSASNTMAARQPSQALEMTDVSETIDLDDIAVEVGEGELSMESSAVEMVDVDVPTEPHTVRENENLWRFSKRVTGNALNWEKIAAFNQLDNASAISAGQTLLVPSDLLADGTGY